MLNGGTLDGAQLSVTSPTEHHDPESAEAHHPDTPIDQTDKPRAGIAAEYLAKGYVLSDGILQRAIELDNQRGISKRFLSYFQSIDSTLGQKALGPDQKISAKVAEKLYQAQEQAKTIDQQKGITTKAGDVRRNFFVDIDEETDDSPILVLHPCFVFAMGSESEGFLHIHLQAGPRHTRGGPQNRLASDRNALRHRRVHWCWQCRAST